MMNFKLNKNIGKTSIKTANKTTSSRTNLKGVKYNSILNKRGASKSKKRTLAQFNKRIDDTPLQQESSKALRNSSKSRLKVNTRSVSPFNERKESSSSSLKVVAHNNRSSNNNLQLVSSTTKNRHDQSFRNYQEEAQQQLQWKQLRLKNVPQGRAHHTATLYKNEYVNEQLSSILICIRIYVIGGRDLAFKSYKDVWKYDIQYQLWAKISFDYKNSPGSLSNHSAVLLNDNIYVYGGLFENNSQNKNIYQFDIQKKSWSLAEVKNKENSPAARDQHVAVADTKSSFVVFGGFTDNKKTNQLWKYSLQTNQWTDLNKTSKTLPAERSGHIMVKYKSFLYTYGGCDENGARLNDLWRFSLEGRREWEIIKIATGEFPIVRRLIESRSGHSAAILKNDKLLIFGGMHGVLHENNELYQLDLDTLNWQKLCSQKLCTTPTKYMPKLQPMLHQIKTLAVLNTQMQPYSSPIISPKNPINRPQTNELVSESSKSLINQKAMASKQRKNTKSREKKFQNFRVNSPTIKIRSPGTRPLTSAASTANSSPKKRFTSLKLSSRVQDKSRRQNLKLVGNLSDSPQKQLSKSPVNQKHEKQIDRSRTLQFQSFNNSKSQMLSTYGHFNQSKHSIKKRANALSKILTGSDLNVPGFNLNQPTMEVMRTSYLFKNVNTNKLDTHKKKKFLLDKSIALVNDQSVNKQNNAIQLSCRRPPAREGHTVTAISESQMLVFGGDRNRMSFNDMYIFSIDGFKDDNDNDDDDYANNDNVDVTSSTRKAALL